MGKTSSLFSLCIDAIKKEIIQCGDDFPQDIYELPLDLFESLMICLPPIALHKLQIHMPVRAWNEDGSANEFPWGKRKRTRCFDFNTLWRKFYMARWPRPVSKNQAMDWLGNPGLEECKLANDWQRMYWETHLQNCLDQVAEVALFPSFDSCIGEVNISDAILGFIGFEGHKDCSRCDCTKLSYHCQQFGSYARYLRLRNVLCVAKSCSLLKSCKLHRLEVQWINSEEHVETLCKLLDQNRESLVSLEFRCCKLPSTLWNAICDSLCLEGQQAHVIQHFSIKASSFIDMDQFKLPTGLASFLSSGRSLTSLILSDNYLGQNFAKILFRTLHDAAPGLSILDLSENNIAGSLSHIGWRSSSCPQLSSGSRNSLQSLRVLNLRGNNLQRSDAASLKSAVIDMPYLEFLDISDNPIGDDGIKSLLPCFIKMSESQCLINLRVENCDFSFAGVKQLLDVLSTFKRPLDSLSLGGNNLSSKAGATLGKFLCTGIKALDIEDIGLGSAGFMEVQDEIREDLKLVFINMSKNRGGVEAAKLLTTLVQWAPELVAVKMAYNLMPCEALATISSALEISKGKLGHLDLSGNTMGDRHVFALALLKFQILGKAIVYDSTTDPCALHDDDP